MLDAAQDCHTAAFQIAPSTTTTRQWDIKVTQYACGDDDNGGPPGCLQYYTGTTGSIANFGFPSTITGTATASGKFNFILKKHNLLIFSVQFQ